MSIRRASGGWGWRWVRVAAVLAAGVAGWTAAQRTLALGGGDDGVKTVAPAGESAGGSAAKAAAPGAALATLDEAVVIGASVSDGFGTTVSPPAGPTGTPERVVLVKFADILAAVTGRSEPLASSTSSFFFQSPDKTAEAQLAFASGRSPKLVFAIDYLFWHAYGFMREADREAALERGLARLDRLPGPIVVTDLPDMSHAVGLMLNRGQVPRKETLAKLNARIAEWASGRKNVVVLPMTGVVADSMANRAVKLGGREFAAGESRGLLTADGLHATAEGEIAVAIEALDRLVAAGVVDKSIAVERDPAVVKSRLLAMKAVKAPAPTPPSAPTPAAPPAMVPEPK